MSHRLWVIILALGAFACGPSDPLPLEFTGEAVETMPQHVGAAAVQTSPRVWTATGALDSGTTIAEHSLLATFFKQECHEFPNADFCPAGIDASAGGGLNEWKFSANTLLGLIYHAEMYSNGLHVECLGEPGAIDGEAFESATEGGDPDRFIVDYYPLLECRETQTYAGSTAYQAYSVDPGYQATLTTRYKAPSGFPGIDFTDVFQVYLTVDADAKSTFLAFNWVGISSLSARAIVLANLVTHRFAVRYQVSGDPFQQVLVAIGTGGVDRATGQPRPGTYHARFTDNQGDEATACVDNVGQRLQSDDAPCTGAGIPVSWDAPAPVADFLGMTEAERTRLASFLAFFATPDPLSDLQVPQGPGDADLYFPIRMR